MKTVKLYQQDVYMKECKAEIVSAEKSDDGGRSTVLLEFDRTVFFPTGGGQSCDRGQVFILADGVRENSEDRTDANASEVIFEIIDVFENGDRVLHRAVPRDNAQACSISADSAVNAADTAFPVAGTRVLQKIDWEHRFDNMQRHCGEHILSGMFYREFGGVNRGFHMGYDYMTIDISLEEKPEFKTLTWEMAKHAELCANEVIWRNEPVTVHRFETREEAAEMPLRKALAIDEDISIVCVGSTENASDCVACCGTHPSSAGQIGLIKIWKIEPNKGMFRVYCEAGKRAYLDYEKKHDIITAIGNKYSAGIDDIEEKMTIAEEKNKAVRFELGNMRKIVIDSRIADIQSELVGNISSNDNERSSFDSNASTALQQSPLVIRKYSDMKPDDLMHIGKPFIGTVDKSDKSHASAAVGKSNKSGASGAADKLIVLADMNTNTVMLFSDGKHFDCGKLVKENAPIYNGKGGGRQDNARAVFPSAEYLDTFIDLLGKHLR